MNQQSTPALNEQLPHPHVHHPGSRLTIKRGPITRTNEQLLDWLSDHVLASILMFDLALILPLIVIPMSDSIKITLGVISGSWIQWWALPALQRSQGKAEASRRAKADVDHVALTHIANTTDVILKRLEALEARADVRVQT